MEAGRSGRSAANRSRLARAVPIGSLCRTQLSSLCQAFYLEQQGATLVVVQSLFHQHEFLETLAGTFAIVIPITLLIAGLGGYFLARSSLSPVVAMSEQARWIGAENLDARLSVRNPEMNLDISPGPSTGFSIGSTHPLIVKSVSWQTRRTNFGRL